MEAAKSYQGKVRSSMAIRILKVDQGLGRPAHRSRNLTRMETFGSKKEKKGCVYGRDPASRDVFLIRQSDRAGA